MSARGDRRPGWLAHPVLSLLIGASWLLLQQSVSAANLLFALLLALAVPRVVHPFLGTGLRLKRPLLALRFAGVVLWDIVVANLTVARLVLSPVSRPEPAWVRVPIGLTDPTAISLLASIVTTTPGTVSCVVDEEKRELVVHALDCRDPQALIDDIRRRYEAPLKEMLG